MSVIRKNLKSLIRRAQALMLEEDRAAVVGNERPVSSVAEIRAVQIATSQAVQVLLFHHYRDLFRRNVKPLPSFSEVGFRCHSQFEEDGILLYIFALIGWTTKTAVEICAGDGTECNTTNLIVNHGFHGFLFDGAESNVASGRKFFAGHKDAFLFPPCFTQAWITAENVNDLVGESGITGEVDLLSLDIDGVDYWVWKALDCIKPRVVVCETQNVIPADMALTVPYDPQFRENTNDFRGASLAAMVGLAEKKGLRLIGVHRYGFNAFFIRNDIAEDVLPTVSVESCLNDPYSRAARRERWPKVKDREWVNVE